MDMGRKIGLSLLLATASYIGCVGQGVYNLYFRGDSPARAINIASVHPDGHPIREDVYTLYKYQIDNREVTVKVAEDWMFIEEGDRVIKVYSGPTTFPPFNLNGTQQIITYNTLNGKIIGGHKERSKVEDLVRKISCRIISEANLPRKLVAFQ